MTLQVVVGGPNYNNNNNNNKSAYFTFCCHNLKIFDGLTGCGGGDFYLSITSSQTLLQSMSPILLECIVK